MYFLIGDTLSIQVCLFVCLDIVVYEGVQKDGILCWEASQEKFPTQVHRSNPFLAYSSGL